ncbi:MAG: minor capsid protein [Bacteroidia bacterium]|nr:minor capsid protein [Bacteroidia bacterium]
MFSRVEAYYGKPGQCGHPECQTPELEAIDLSGWEKLIKHLATEMQQGNLKPAQLNRESLLKTFEELNKGAASGYGKGWQNSNEKKPPSRDALLMQRNIYRFSGAKNYAMLLEMNSKLTKDGQRVSEEEFLQEALKLNKNLNINHAQAEYQTAAHSSTMAAQWESFQRNKKLYPNLKYKTQGDDRVRDDHRSLDGKIAPIDSDFWKRYYPPNGFRCRCYVVQTAATPSEEIPTEVPEVKPEFRINVGLTHQVFNEDGKSAHPYFILSKRVPQVRQRIETYLVQKNRQDVRDWAYGSLSGKSIKNEKVAKGIKISNADIKHITGGSHKDQLDRNDLLYNLSDVFAGAQFVREAPETRGRYQYLRWLYFKAAEGDFFFNVVELRDGTLKLHSITDKIKGAE